MFRPQNNSFDQLVVNATDENLTSENWEKILDVIEKTNKSPNGPKDAVQAVLKRLPHRNANVQLYTLELANALIKNCGIAVHNELASKSFTDALLTLVKERNTHPKVKGKIAEFMESWSDIFRSDPTLGYMEDAYAKLKQQNPYLRPPSQPPKEQITENERLQEEKDLRWALELSMKDRHTTASNTQQQNTVITSANAATNQQSDTAQNSQSTNTTAATVTRVRALYDFDTPEPGELKFRKGDIIYVLASVYHEWWKGSLHNKVGIFPLNYVEKLQDPTPADLEKEAQMEAEVFAQIKNVEKLLALLSTADTGRADVQENDEITELYHQTLAVRPKLIELIGKYSQKREEFNILNEKFIKARRNYENLLEASMSHPVQSIHGHAPYAPNNMPPYSGHSQTIYPTANYGPQQQQQYHPQPPQNSNDPAYIVNPNNHQQQLSSPTSMQPVQQQRPASLAYDSRVQPPPVSLAPVPSPSAPQELASSSFDIPVSHAYPGQHQPSNPYTPMNQQQPSAPESAYQYPPVTQNSKHTPQPYQQFQQPPQQQQPHPYPGYQSYQPNQHGSLPTRDVPETST